MSAEAEAKTAPGAHGKGDGAGAAPRVLVTGASGYIATQIVRLLMAAGWQVRGTVRSLRNKDRVDHLKALYPGSAYPLELVEANLDEDGGWDAACKGCTFVLHTASPFPRDPPKDESALLETATGGTMRVLNAAKKAGVKRVVVTSSIAAIAYGVDQESKIFDESDWTNVAPKVKEHKVPPYMKSKTLAEKAAWAFADKEGLELATVNPGLVFGPVLSSNGGTSTQIAYDFLAGKIPALADMHFPLVDVRDVAYLHALAMVTPAAKGQRHIAVAGTYGLAEYANAAAEVYNPMGYKIPSRHAPSCLVKCFSCCDANMAAIKDSLGVKPKFDHAKGAKLMGRNFRDGVQAFLDHCDSVIANGTNGIDDKRPAGEKGTNKFASEKYDAAELGRVTPASWTALGTPAPAPAAAGESK